MKVSKIRNIGPVSRTWLHEVGIYSLEDLQACGSVATFRMIKSIRPQVSLNLLWALEGAIVDVDWRELPQAHKRLLREEVKGEYFPPRVGD
ncbi:MAG: TfoX/Sxy family protein [Ardenticatenaceae bacterium]